MSNIEQTNLFGEKVTATTVAKPFIKWVGGKRGILETLIQHMPKEFESYSEPFLGGGAVFFGVRSRGFSGKATLSDVNKRLITTYQSVRDNVDKIVKNLGVHSKNHDLDYYMAARPELSTEEDPIKLASWFIYLNKTSFNGIYRENSKGGYNVPIGTLKSTAVLDEDNLRAVSLVLESAVLLNRSFSEVDSNEADFFYLDPPYDETYTGYSKGGFNADDQALVAKLCKDIDTAGNKFLVSNSDTPLIRELYEGYMMEVIKAPRSVNSDGKGRGRVGELLIRNY